MASAMEAEIAAMFMNAQLAIEFRQTLRDMGHPQPPTRMRTDSQSGHGVVTGTMQQKRSKAIDMRFHWLKDRIVNHEEFDLSWAPGATNLGDYPTKHHTGKHHRMTRPIWVNIEGESPTTLQGCTKILSHGYQNKAKHKIQSSESFIHTVLNNSVTKSLQRLLPAYTHKLYTTSKW